MPEDERVLVAAMRAMTLGDEDEAFKKVKRALHLADGACLAGFIALRLKRFKWAERYLRLALEKRARLGKYCDKYDVSIQVSLPVTDSIYTDIQCDERGVLLALVELQQRDENWREALKLLERLRRLAPEELIVKLSLAEVLLESTGDRKAICRKVLKLGEGVENLSAAHAALMLYKARALRELGLDSAARETLGAALRRRKDRPEDLMMALRYERALAYEGENKKAAARKDLEKIYAWDADYEDVAVRLGM